MKQMLRKLIKTISVIVWRLKYKIIFKPTYLKTRRILRNYSEMISEGKGRWYSLKKLIFIYMRWYYPKPILSLMRIFFRTNSPKENHVDDGRKSFTLLAKLRVEQEK